MPSWRGTPAGLGGSRKSASACGGCGGSSGCAGPRSVSPSESTGFSGGLLLELAVADMVGSVEKVLPIGKQRVFRDQASAMLSHRYRIPVSQRPNGEDYEHSAKRTRNRCRRYRQSRAARAEIR
ncbi:hypothetical protein BURKHO8Y_180081 [Burkholderia sp. 8Y]|nr:hypothetical protein BURKHO8Y_180081 [Burkholderia sp. 8Y]